MIKNVDAVRELYKIHHANSGLYISGKCESDLSGVTLTDGSSLSFTFEDVLAKKKELEDEYKKQAYARSRQSEYPKLQDCIHALLDGGDTLTELQSKRSEIKKKYPKPT